MWASYVPAACTRRRLHAVVPRLLRCAREDDVLPSGYKITAGTNVIYQTYMLHRDERFWGPDALQFDPERWMDERTKRCARAARDRWQQLADGWHHRRPGPSATAACKPTSSCRSTAGRGAYARRRADIDPLGCFGADDAASWSGAFVTRVRSASASRWPTTRSPLRPPCCFGYVALQDAPKFLSPGAHIARPASRRHDKQHFRFTLVPNHTVTAESSLTLGTADGVYVTVTERTK